MIYDVLIGETIVPNQNPVNVTDKVVSNVVETETPIGSLSPVFRSWNFPRPITTYSLGENRILFGSAAIRTFTFIVSSNHGTQLICNPKQIFTGLNELYFSINNKKSLTYKYYVDKDNEYQVGVILNDNNEVLKPSTLTERANSIMSDPSNCVFECVINPDRSVFGIDNIEWYIGKTSQEIRYGFGSVQTIATDSYLITFTVDFSGTVTTVQPRSHDSYVYVNKGTDYLPILIKPLYVIDTIVNKNTNSKIYRYISDDVSSRIDTLEEAIGPISAKINGANSIYVSR